MAKGVIKYDYTFMAADTVAGFGFKNSELVNLGKDLKSINKFLKDNGNEPDLSFRKLPNDKKNLKQILSLGRKLYRDFDNMVVVGIGGSDLGARAIFHALAGQYANQDPKRKLKVYFLGDTTDSQGMADLLKIINLKKTVFYIVSKSGNTIEPLSTFLYLRKKVISKVGKRKHVKHFIITTNPDKGSLLKIAKKEGYLVLPHYVGGGRFSVLSVNGLLPATAAGFDTQALLSGARAIDRLCKNNSYKKNPVFFFAALQYLAYTKRDQNISVLMPYTPALKDFALWFRQLWGESLSNAYDSKGKRVHIGITPLVATGPADQHSQIQNFIEGPYDKIITFIFVDQIKDDLKVPKYNGADVEYLGGHRFSDILDIEHDATSVSLMKNKRANGTIILPQLDEYYLGQLFYFFQMATVYLGQLLQVNVYDQPGVEQSKKYMYGLLGKPGHAKDKNEILNV